MLFQRVEQRRREPEVALHKLRRVLRTVHARKIENEVRILAVQVQFFRRTAQIVFIERKISFDSIVLRLAVTDITQLGKKVLSYEARGSRNQYVHFVWGGHSKRCGPQRNEM